MSQTTTTTTKPFVPSKEYESKNEQKNVFLVKHLSQDKDGIKKTPEVNNINVANCLHNM